MSNLNGSTLAVTPSYTPLSRGNQGRKVFDLGVNSTAKKTKEKIVIVQTVIKIVKRNFYFFSTLFV